MTTNILFKNNFFITQEAKVANINSFSFKNLENNSEFLLGEKTGICYFDKNGQFNFVEFKCVSWLGKNCRFDEKDAKQIFENYINQANSVEFVENLSSSFVKEIYDTINKVFAVSGEIIYAQHVETASKTG